MKSDVLKKFFTEYKEYLVATEHTRNVADQYCSYLRKACILSDLGVGFIEAIAAIADANVQAALCEYLMAKLSNAFETTVDKLQKKKISDYKSAVSALSGFITQENDEKAEALSLLPAVELPFESVYDQKALIKKFKDRLVTQERYYYGDGASFSARVINRIATKTKRRNIYKNLILNTRFLYHACEEDFFLLKDITRLTIQTDGFVKIEVDGKTYDVYTQVYKEGKFAGFERLRVGSVELVSLDHVHSMHELYPPFLKDHSELCKFSDHVLKYRLKNLNMRLDKFATYYFNEVYSKIAAEEGFVVDENLLMDQVCAFIAKLELLIIHKSYNSSKNDSVKEEEVTC